MALNAFRKMLYVTGVVVSAFAILLLAIGYSLVESGAFGGVVVGVAFIAYYVIFGTIGAFLILVGHVPELPLKVPVGLVPAVLAAPELILSTLLLLELSEINPSNFLLYLPPFLLLLRVVLARKGVVTSSFDAKEYRFFKKIKI